MHNQPVRCSLHTEHIFTPPECNLGRSAWRLPLHTQITHWLVRVRACARVCVFVCLRLSAISAVNKANTVVPVYLEQGASGFHTL